MASRSAEAPLAVEHAVARLTAGHPGARVRVRNERIRRVYGMAATGDTPDASAESFRRSSAAAFGVDPDDLTPAKLARSVRPSHAAANTDGVGLMYDRATGKYKFRLFTYQQHRDGIPVFRSSLRTLVREEAQNPVVWANADLRPMGSFRIGTGARPGPVDVDKSLRALRTSAALASQRLPAPTALTDVSRPTLTIFAGLGDKNATPRLATQYTARAAHGPGKWTFVADAASGDVLHVESNLHFDIHGTVAAEVVTGPESMECGVLGARPLPHARVSSAAGDAVTDAAGGFTIVESGSGTDTLVSDLTGEYFDVTTEAGTPASLSLSVTPPGPASFLHRDTAVPPELVLAQLNAYKQVNEVRDMLLTYLPDYPVIAEQTGFPINVNRTDFTCEITGGAWYDDDSPARSLNFCQRTAERANTAFASIVHHEYGHHIVDSGGSGQSEYGEGMADVIAMLFSKDPRMGVGYHLNQCDEPLRSADNDCQYSATECSSCGPGLYECSAVLTGTIWDIWQELGVSEPDDADDLLRSLVLSSIPLHTGTSIDESIAIDLLTLDDDDGLLENGTPHYVEICTGFQQHGMDCPPIVGGLVVKNADLAAEGPSDGPFEPASVSYTLHNLGPEETLTYSVSIPPDATWLTVDETGGTIALGEQATVTVSIDQAEAALLPDGSYSAAITFVNESSGVGNVTREAKLRVGAPVPIYVATFDDDLEGFTVDTEPGNLWHHSVGCVDLLPGHSAPGSLYYGKPDLCDYTAPTPIRHAITSPPIAIANPGMAELGFNYFLETENDPNYDNADVLVSVDGGPFEIVASNHGVGVRLDETNAWRPVRLDLSGMMPSTGPTSVQLQLAFNAVDPNSNTKRGFAVDDLTVYAQTVTCTGDSDCDDGDECTDDVCDDGVCAHSDNGSCGAAGAFIEVNGTVVIEAENFSSNTPRAAHRWDRLMNGQASGQALMSANPNTGHFINGNYTATSPELGYPIQFSTTGTYYVWIRGSGPTADDDSCHVGLDGNGPPTADRITGFPSALGWTRSTMDGPLATLHVTQPGLRELDVWMREDGFSIDKIVLTTNPWFSPSGAGPAESARQGLGQDPCAAFCANPVTFTSNNHQSGNLGTNASCHATTASLSGGVCGNLVNPRKLFVNGVQMPCTWTPWPSLPPATNGGYCIYTTSGNHPWAAFATW